MEELRHFGHGHPLTFSQLDKNDNDEDIVCNCCLQKISGFAYRCGTRSPSSCSFFLHKFCAEQLPETMKNPVLHKHSLSLFSKDYELPRSHCRVCKTLVVRGFFYFCHSCEVVVDASCVARTLTVKHPSHKHPLSPVITAAVFVCHACRMEKPKGISYMCNICSFWIHEDCAMLPPTYKDASHIHPLVLTYRHTTSKYLGFSCRICEGDFRSQPWTYHCRVCRHTIHLHCRSKTQRIETSRIAENRDDEANLFHLPLTDDSVSLIDLLLMKHANAGQKDDNNTTHMGEEKEKLIHFSHEHPLTLVNYVHSDDNDKLCCACVRPISSLIYGCNPCNFFLHKWCSQLPKQLQHPCHEKHTLILLRNRPYSSEVFKCKNCGDHSNGFYFSCAECNDYFLDVKCASLPSTIKHDLHEHPLFLKLDLVSLKSEGCAACFGRVNMFLYGCGKCNFSLHYQCALLPRTITHRYDKHPFTLTYDPIKDGPDDYYCEFCEREILPGRGWFYHCIDCDQSACVKCIYKKKEWGNTSTSHPHPLSLVQAMNKYPLCQRCQHTCSWNHTFTKPFTYEQHSCSCYHTFTESFTCEQCEIMHHQETTSFTCEQCKIMLHQECALPGLGYWTLMTTLRMRNSDYRIKLSEPDKDIDESTRLSDIEDELCELLSDDATNSIVEEFERNFIRIEDELCELLSDKDIDELCEVDESDQRTIVEEFGLQD